MANYRQVARRAAQRYGLDPGVFERQIQQESRFNPGARSSAGAVGIAQIMPDTARGWGVDPTDPRAALNAAAKNMARYVKQYGSYKNALVAYNAGPGRVGGSLPAETRNYINVILGGRNPSTSGVSPSAGSPGTPGTPGTTITDTHLAFDPGAAQTAPGLKLPARPQPQITAPTAPDFAARAVTPTGYQAPEAPASSPAKAARFDAGQTLEALQALSSGGTKTVKTTATVGGTPGTPASGGSYRSGGAKGSKVLELIYNNGGKGFGIKDGQTVSGSSVFSGVWNGHRNHVHVAAGPQTVVALGKLAQGMGLHVGENPHFGGVDPVHAPNSYHYKGEAIDVSGDAQKMGRFAQAVQRYNRTHKLPG
jgi:hypothetical protein